MVSDKKIFTMFFFFFFFYNVFPISAYINNVTPGRGHFWHHGHNLNKFVRDPLGDATYKISMI